MSQEVSPPQRLRDSIFRESRAERLCAKASGAILCQTPHHELDHGNANPGFLTAWEHFIVFGKPPPGGKPGKGPLHNPSPLLNAGRAVLSF